VNHVGKLLQDSVKVLAGPAGWCLRAEHVDQFVPAAVRLTQTDLPRRSRKIWPVAAQHATQRIAIRMHQPGPSE
jgi:hypothetical protein